MTDLFSARRFKVIPLAAVILACVLAASSSAEARDIYKECNGGNDTAGIVEACSSVLRRGSLESTSNRKQAFFYRGYAYQRTNRLDESFADYRAALTIDPGYFAPKNNLAVGLANRGNEASRRKDYGQALTDFAEALRLKPNDVLSLNNLAAIHYKEGDFGRAIPLCTLAIQNDPKSITAYDICGRSFLGKGDLKNAVIALTRFRLSSPDARTMMKRRVRRKHWTRPTACSPRQRPPWSRHGRRWNLLLWRLSLPRLSLLPRSGLRQAKSASHW